MKNDKLILRKERFRFLNTPDVEDDSGIRKCNEFPFSNSVYSVYTKGNETQNCIVGEY